MAASSVARSGIWPVLAHETQARSAAKVPPTRTGVEKVVIGPIFNVQ
jgi:hypothetical protein